VNHQQTRYGAEPNIVGTIPSDHNLILIEAALP